MRGGSHLVRGGNLAPFGDTRQMLAAKAADAEPQREAASSAAQAWHARVDAEITVLTGQQEAAQQKAEDAQDAEDGHDQQLLDAERAIAEIDASLGSASRELSQIDDLVEEARHHGDLMAGQSVPSALDEARTQTSGLDEQADEALDRRRARSRS